MEQILFLPFRIEILLCIHRHRDQHLICQFHQHPQHLILNRRKARKAIHRHNAATDKCGVGQPLSKKFQRLFRRHILFCRKFHKRPVQYAQILQFPVQPPSPPGKFRQLIQFIYPDPILHEFRNRGLHFVDISRFIQVSPDELRLILSFPRNSAQHQALARIIQDDPLILPHFLKDAVRQTPERKHVDVHDPLPGMHAHQIHLRLHGELIRHNDQIIPVGLLYGTPDDFLIKRGALPSP